VDKVERKLPKRPADALSARKSTHMREVLRSARILVRLPCLLGFHSFRVIEKVVCFGSGGNVEKVQCKRCGLTVTRQG
jgi:hypothetical protein